MKLRGNKRMRQFARDIIFIAVCAILFCMVYSYVINAQEVAQQDKVLSCIRTCYNLDSEAAYDRCVRRCYAIFGGQGR
jgi:hypothetical protein